MWYRDFYRVKRRQARAVAEAALARRRLVGTNLPRDNPVGLIAMMRGCGNTTRAHPQIKYIAIDPSCLKKPQPEWLKKARWCGPSCPLRKNGVTPIPAEPVQP